MYLGNYYDEEGENKKIKRGCTYQFLPTLHQSSMKNLIKSESLETILSLYFIMIQAYPEAAAGVTRNLYNNRQSLITCAKTCISYF